GVSLRRPGGHQRAAQSQRVRIRAARHRRLQGEPLLRRVRRVCQGSAGGHPDQDHGLQPWPGGSRAAGAADLVVPQRLGVMAGAPRREADPAGNQGTGGREHARGKACRPGDVSSVLRRRRPAARDRERDQPRPAPPRLCGRWPVPQGRHQRLRGPRAEGGGERRAAGHQGGGALPAEGRPRRVGGGAWLEEHRAHPLHHGSREFRNREWFHMINDDIISMPDKWEYPWYAAWDLAFHTLPIGIVDLDFAKEQLQLMLRGHYLHPNGQVPAYEWNFSDVNPPVHAFATLFLY